MNLICREYEYDFRFEWVKTIENVVVENKNPENGRSKGDC